MFSNTPSRRYRARWTCFPSDRSSCKRKQQSHPPGLGTYSVNMDNCSDSNTTCRRNSRKRFSLLKTAGPSPWGAMLTNVTSVATCGFSTTPAGTGIVRNVRGLNGPNGLINWLVTFCPCSTFISCSPFPKKLAQSYGLLPPATKQRFLSRAEKRWEKPKLFQCSAG